MTDPAQQRADAIKAQRIANGTLGRVLTDLCGICPDPHDCAIPCDRPTLGQSVTQAFETVFGRSNHPAVDLAADEGPAVDEWVSPNEEARLQRRADDRTEGIYR